LVFVTNVAPTLATGTGATITEGSTFTRPVSLSDPGADAWTGRVDYGDGSPVATLSGLTAGAPFTLSHLYVDDGQYPVLVTVNDDDGGVGTQSFSVRVTNVAPTVDAGPDQTVAEGTPVTLV